MVFFFVKSTLLNHIILAVLPCKMAWRLKKNEQAHSTSAAQLDYYSNVLTLGKKSFLLKKHPEIDTGFGQPTVAMACA